MCNEANEFVLPLEENDVNNSDLLPTLASEDTPLNVSTFKLKLLLKLVYLSYVYSSSESVFF